MPSPPCDDRRNGGRCENEDHGGDFEEAAFAERCTGDEDEENGCAEAVRGGGPGNGVHREGGGQERAEEDPDEKEEDCREGGQRRRADSRGETRGFHFPSGDPEGSASEEEGYRDPDQRPFPSVLTLLGGPGEEQGLHEEENPEQGVDGKGERRLRLRDRVDRETQERPGCECENRKEGGRPRRSGSADRRGTEGDPRQDEEVDEKGDRREMRGGWLAVRVEDDELDRRDPAEGGDDPGEGVPRQRAQGVHDDSPGDEEEQSAHRIHENTEDRSSDDRDEAEPSAHAQERRGGNRAPPIAQFLAGHPREHGSREREDEGEESDESDLRGIWDRVPEQGDETGAREEDEERGGDRERVGAQARLTGFSRRR